MGRLTTRAMEYLNGHFTLYEAEERLLNFGFFFSGFTAERGSDLRGKENETESWLAAEEEAEKNSDTAKRSGKSETVEHRAMVLCEELGSESDDMGFYLYRQSLKKKSNYLY